MRPYPKTPELDKLAAIKGKSQIIGEFLVWLSDERGLHLGEYHEHTDECQTFGGCGMRQGELYLASPGIENLLAEYFGIDLKKVAEEKDAVLDWERERQVSKVATGEE